MLLRMTGTAPPPQSVYQLDRVSDADLLAGTRRLVGRSNQVLAELLAHLAEVEARGIHRLRACPSLYMYCVYELRLSEDAAFRRARAARVAWEFPVIFRQVADGELHLTALVLLAPHLTEGNHRELLALAKHRTKREILRIVRTLAPEPSVPDRVEPLGPERVGIPLPAAPSWRRLVEALAAGVRELSPGDRPKDWVDRAGAAVEPECAEGHPSGTETVGFAGVPLALARQRYKVEFTGSQEYVDLLNRAQDLLSHAIPDRSLEEVHLRALRLLVERLEKRKYGAPRPKTSAPLKGSVSKKHAHVPRRCGTAAVRREVRDRDGNQCTFVDASGRRCPETRRLELHHRLAYGQGGDSVAGNLTMYCAAHNALAAEQDFGRKFIEERRRGGGPQRKQSARSPPRD